MRPQTTKAKAVLFYKSGYMGVADVDWPPPAEWRVPRMRVPSIEPPGDMSAPQPEPHRFYLSSRWTVSDLKWRLETFDVPGVTEENGFVYFEDCKD